MKRRFTEKEAAAILKQMGILADTREQVWDHVKKSLESLKCPVERGKLDQGDYTAFVPMNAFPGCGGVPGITSLQDEIVIERKANLDEIAGKDVYKRQAFCFVYIVLHVASGVILPCDSNLVILLGLWHCQVFLTFV